MNTRTLPRHPVTGLPALGWRRPRPGEHGAQPIWPILGAAETGEDDDSTGDDDNEQDQDDEDADPDGAEQLGDPGKRALDAMKSKMHSERDRRRAAENELAQLKAAGTGEGTDAVEAARQQARAEARAEGLRERAMDRLEAKAARLFADPEDARAYLASQVEDFIDGDSIDTDAINEALQDLLKRKPYLAAAQAAGSRPKFEGTGDGGARKGNAGPKQLGDNDLKTMTSDQIVAAQKAGQFRDLLGG